MKFIALFLFTLSLCIGVEASQFSLAKIDANTYETHILKIKNAIASDDTKQDILPFDKDQSFLLKGNEEQRIGYFIPVKFNSKFYKNTICRLYFLDMNNDLKYAELFAEKNDDDDVVPSCVGIEAVSIQEIANSEASYLAILRYRTVNTYGSRGVVVSYKNGNVRYDKKLNDCINTRGPVSTIGSLKKKMLSCK